MSSSENRFPLFRDMRALTPVFTGYALAAAKNTIASSIDATV